MHQSTGAIVELKGNFNPKDLYVNHGNKKIRFNSKGVSSFIGIAPYHPYQIDIGNDSEQSYDIRPAKEDEILRLFPGNIAVVKYIVKPKFPLYATFKCNGRELSKQVLVSSIDTTRTDEYGFAIIDVLYGDTIYVLNKNGEKEKALKFSTKGIKVEDGFAYRDSLSCVRQKGSNEAVDRVLYQPPRPQAIVADAALIEPVDADTSTKPKENTTASPNKLTVDQISLSKIVSDSISKIAEATLMPKKKKNTTGVEQKIVAATEAEPTKKTLTPVKTETIEKALTPEKPETAVKVVNADTSKAAESTKFTEKERAPEKPETAVKVVKADRSKSTTTSMAAKTAKSAEIVKRKAAQIKAKLVEQASKMPKVKEHLAKKKEDAKTKLAKKEGAAEPTEKAVKNDTSKAAESTKSTEKARASEKTETAVKVVNADKSRELSNMTEHEKTTHIKAKLVEQMSKTPKVREQLGVNQEDVEIKLAQQEPTGTEEKVVTKDGDAERALIPERDMSGSKRVAIDHDEPNGLDSTHNEISSETELAMDDLSDLDPTKLDVQSMTARHDKVKNEYETLNPSESFYRARSRKKSNNVLNTMTDVFRVR